MKQISETPLLELKKVIKYYNAATPALSDVSFSVTGGQFISVIGPSGSGKSTLLRCINRMIEVTSGEIFFDGVMTSTLGKRDLRKLRTRIGMVFQHYNLVERLSVIENVLHGRLGYKSTLAGIMGRYSREEKKQAHRIIDMLGLGEQVYKRCDQLSGGQKQRVGIARALVQNPKIILCDEPISSLDPNSSRVIMDHLKGISRSLDITLIVNLHQVNTAMKYSDRIIGVNQGEVVFDGTPAELSTERISRIYGSEPGESVAGWGEYHAN